MCEASTRCGSNAFAARRVSRTSHGARRSSATSRCGAGARGRRVCAARTTARRRGCRSSRRRCRIVATWPSDRFGSAWRSGAASEGGGGRPFALSVARRRPELSCLTVLSSRGSFRRVARRHFDISISRDSSCTAARAHGETVAAQGARRASRARVDLCTRRTDERAQTAALGLRRPAASLRVAMRLKRLTIHGFKSYRDQTVVDPFQCVLGSCLRALRCELA